MIVVSRILNVLALAFTIAFSAFLLLFVKWRALNSECIVRDTCDISEVTFLSYYKRAASNHTCLNLAQTPSKSAAKMALVSNLAHISHKHAANS